MQDLGGLLCHSITQPPALLLLDGDLGAGKTTLSQGFVRHFAGETRVTSPTYLLSNLYKNQDNVE